ncbi:winged helix DNA-binding domain-containing protein [Amycolatopsis sp. 195334CR]|uniref:winged helix DNA-binding domain-containing protein n=1 Tax=Amycolatopsis sp. 195334CR TaxID=2814588 RepID=UPI001A8CB797|nr:winged helix DNA-binding domain-containing protein [Amycolatopsis sp. 195334CR]MBN6035305.1 AlkZ family DNA glycosylase [Amycolatopsis sp. 195334CR]
MSTGDVLTTRALNRATLSRQLLLERERMSAYDAVEHLAGLQAQSPSPPYFALWTRLVGFQPDELAQLLLDRRVVRIVTMRGTVHLLTARDALDWRSLTQPIMETDLRGNTQHSPHWQDLDFAAVAAHARELLAEEPRSAKVLGEALAERWPGRAPSSLTQVARNLLPLVQIPPRGLWGKSGQPTYVTLDDWIGEAIPSNPSPEDFVLRYLRAFGPASVQDVQAWCGLTRLGEVVDRLRPRLRSFRNEAGRELFDLPGAPRPDPDTPAPARFLGGFDQNVLSFADRTRVLSEEYRKRIFTKNGLIPQVVLVDGFVCGRWSLGRDKGIATLAVEPFEKISKKDIRALEKEGAELLRFAEPTAKGHDFRIDW